MSPARWTRSVRASSNPKRQSAYMISGGGSHTSAGDHHPSVVNVPASPDRACSGDPDPMVGGSRWDGGQALWPWRCGTSTSRARPDERAAVGVSYSVALSGNMKNQC